MIISPIIPIWLMAVLCIGLIILIKNKDIKVFIRRLIIIMLLFIINLRIMVPTDNAKVMTSNLDIFFVVDSTLSMLAEDMSEKSNRLEAVKSDCKYILDELSGANYSVMTFNNEPKVITPLTKDSNMTLAAIDAISTMQENYATGSSMNKIIDDLEDALKKASEKNDRKSVVFFISDGEITSDEKLESYSGTKKYISNGAVLGYGTEKGGNMKIKDSYTEKTKYLEDTTSSTYPYPKAVSKIDENNLKQIAKDMGIDYINMSKQANIKSKLNQIKQAAVHDLDDTDKMLYNDIYFIFVIPLMILLIYEFIIYKKKL